MNSQSYAIPISVKGIVFEENKVWLRKNERQEWELPGGKLDPGEQPTETIVREIEEELGLQVTPKKLIGAHLYAIDVSVDESKGVLVLSYLCEINKRVSDFEWEGEAGKAEFHTFLVSEVKNLNMSEFYKIAILEAGSNN